MSHPAPDYSEYAASETEVDSMIAAQINADDEANDAAAHGLTVVSPGYVAEGETVHAALKRQMFTDFIDWLNAHSIRYCLLGDTRQYPGHIDGDIDIVVDDAQLLDVVTMLSQIEFAPLSLVQVIQHEPTAYYLTMVVLPEEIAASPVYLHPDLCSHYYQNSRLMLTAETLLTDRVLDAHGYYVPQPAAAFAYYFLKCVEKRILDAPRQNYLLSLYQQAPSEAIAGIQSFFCEDTLAFIEQALQAENPSALTNELCHFHTELHKTVKRRFEDWCQKAALTLKRIAFPTGYTLAFVGPDGAGKTTLLEAVEEQFKPVFRRGLWRHLRPQLWQKVRRDRAKVERNPHGRLPRSIVSSIGKVIWFFVEAHLAYWAVVYPAMVQSTLVIFDRYLTDFYADPKRFRYRGPMWITWTLARLSPQPNQLIIVVAEPDVLQARKAEVSFAESRRQVVEYRHCSYHTSHSLLVETECPPEESIRFVTHWLLQLMHQRTQKRFGRRFVP